MTLFEWLQLGLGVISILVIPLVVVLYNRQQVDRRKQFDGMLEKIDEVKNSTHEKIAESKTEMHAKIDEVKGDVRAVSTDVKHLDDCFDGLKVRVAGDMATRADVQALRADVNATISSVSDSFRTSMSERDARIMRLENKFLVPGGDSR